MAEELKGKKFKFRSDARRNVVYKDGKVVAEFEDNSFETDDKDLAKFLEGRGYQEWDLTTADDILTFEGGTISLRELAKEAPEVAKQLIGLPKLLAKKAASALPDVKKHITGSKESKESKPEDDAPPPALFICAFCGRDDFKSQPALNGHKANCPDKPPKE